MFNFIFSLVFMYLVALGGFRLGRLVWEYATFNRGWRGFNWDD